MSIITNIAHCKAKMSAAGWELFRKHKLVDPLNPFDPADCEGDEEIMLSYLEQLQYEYSQTRSNGKQCATCNEARHSPSGRVACAYLNDLDRMGKVARKLTGRDIEDPKEMHAVVNQIVPEAVVVYLGWGYLGRRHGQTESKSIGQGVMTNNVYLLDEDSFCPEWTERQP